MLSVLSLLSKASAKLVATFVLVIVLMVLAFAFFPGAIKGLQDFVETLNESLRNPPLLDEQGIILYRTLVNENTIFGIIMTLVARSVVELFALIGGSVWKMMRG